VEKKRRKSPVVLHRTEGGNGSDSFLIRKSDEGKKSLAHSYSEDISSGGQGTIITIYYCTRGKEVT